MDKRTRARQIAMQALYQLDVRGKEALEDIDRFFEESDEDPYCRELAKKWFTGTMENMEQCDKMIEESTMKWSISRLSLVDKAILRLAVYQLCFCEDMPPKVAIDEGIELAKIYSSEKAPSFINGVLDAIMKKFPEKIQKTNVNSDKTS